MAVKNKQLSDIKIVWKMLNLYHIASDTVNIKRWGGGHIGPVTMETVVSYLEIKFINKLKRNSSTSNIF